jgi:hypothetical protein
MLNKIIRFFRSEPSVASITSAFVKQVQALDELADAKRDEVMNCAMKIDALHEQQKAAMKESHRAAVISARIEALIED